MFHSVRWILSSLRYNLKDIAMSHPIKVEDHVNISSAEGELLRVHIEAYYMVEDNCPIIYENPTFSMSTSTLLILNMTNTYYVATQIEEAAKRLIYEDWRNRQSPAYED